MPSLRLRLPGRVEQLGAWLACLFPGVDRAERRRWIEEGRISIDGQRADRASLACEPGARMEIADVPSEVIPPPPFGAHSNWIGLVDAVPWPGGSLDLPGGGAGPGEAEGGAEVEFEIDPARDGLAVVRLRTVEVSAAGIGTELADVAVGAAGAEVDAGRLAQGLGDAGLPIVGDLERGGLGVPGGLCLAPDPGPGPLPFDWPEEPAWSDDEDDSEPPVFRVSLETARAIEKGHPWILADDASDAAARFRPGCLMSVVSRAGQALGWARAEGEGRIAARVWAAGSVSESKIPSVDSRVARAIARRRDLLVDVAESGTNAFRLVHGEGDALPGLFVDRLGPLMRVLVTGRASDGFRERVVDALRAQLPLTPEGEPWSILELLHLREPERSAGAGAGRARFDRVRWIEGGLERLAECGHSPSEIGFDVREEGLRFHVDPGWASPRRVRPGFGLFLDQRENRRRLAPHTARGGHWLNLFAHTGAFSASLLAAGAERVTSVDLSAAYLERLEENLRANADQGVDAARHESVRIDGRRFLETLPPEARFAGIVLDPPTAAAAGHRFWSLSRDLEPILRRCIAHLAPGGVLLVTQNRSGPPLGLDRVLSRLARRARRSISELEAAPAGHDHPGLPGFPEGEPFEGWLLRLE